MPIDPSPAAPAAEQRPLLSGQGLPRRTLGTTGDHYVDLVGWLVFGPKRQGHWRTGEPLVVRRRPRTTADDRPLATAHGLVLTTRSGAHLAGDQQ